MRRVAAPAVLIAAAAVAAGRADAGAREPTASVRTDPPACAAGALTIAALGVAWLLRRRWIADHAAFESQGPS